MSQFDGTGEKRREGGDSGAFRGRRHPFLDRGVDWKEIDRARHGAEVAGDSGISDRTAMPREVIDFELTGLDPDPSELRVGACVAAVKKLARDRGKWNVIRDCLMKEYQSAGDDVEKAERMLFGFISAVNRQLGKAGRIEFRKVDGKKAEQIARAENAIDPPLTLSIRVSHPGGYLGPIGVCFTQP